MVCSSPFCYFLLIEFTHSCDFSDYHSAANFQPHFLLQSQSPQSCSLKGIHPWSISSRLLSRVLACLTRDACQLLDQLLKIYTNHLLFLTLNHCLLLPSDSSLTPLLLHYSISSICSCLFLLFHCNPNFRCRAHELSYGNCPPGLITTAFVRGILIFLPGPPP